MSTQKIATSTFWQLASQIVMAALSILTVKFVAIGLSKELAGNYNSAYGFLQLFGILADFGLYAVAVREVSKAGEKKADVLGALIILRVIILLISLLSAIALVWIIPAWKGTPLPLGVTIAALVPFFTLLAGIIRTVFQVNYKMHYVFFGEVTQRIVTTGFIGLFILFGIRGSHDLHIYHLFLFIGGIGAFVLFFISLTCGNRLMKIQSHWEPELMKRLFRAAAPFGFAFLFTALYRNIDVSLIALLRDDFDLQNAYYGFVIRMAEMGYLIPTFLLNSTLPILSERDARGEDTSGLLGKTFLIILLLGSVSFLFSFLWSRPLIQLLTTEQYLSYINASGDLIPGSDTALRLLALPIFLNGIVVYCFYVLLTKNLWKQLVLSLGLGALASIILNLILIPTHGFVGAGYAANITSVLLVLMLLPQGLRAMQMTLARRHWLQWLSFSGLLACGLWLYQPLLTGEIQTIIALISMSVLMVVLGLLVGLRKTFAM